jgi:FeoB-associated Cys-rich membrane protein
MTLDWQTSIAAAMVLVAAAYLGRRAWKTVARKSAGCGACPSCPADQDSAGKPLVQLDTRSKPRSP